MIPPSSSLMPIKSEGIDWQRNYNTNKFYNRNQGVFNQNELIAMRNNGRIQQQQMIRNQNRKNYSSPFFNSNTGPKPLNNNRSSNSFIFRFKKIIFSDYF